MTLLIAMAYAVILVLVPVALGALIIADLRDEHEIERSCRERDQKGAPK